MVLGERVFFAHVDERDLPAGDPLQADVGGGGLADHEVKLLEASHRFGSTVLE